MKITVKHAEGVQCPRCWHFHSVMGNYDNLCDSCVKTILEHFPGHPSVLLIQESLEAQRKAFSLIAS